MAEIKLNVMFCQSPNRQVDCMQVLARQVAVWQASIHS